VHARADPGHQREATLTPPAPETLDVTTLEVWWSRLVAITDEAATTLLRTAFSTIIRESNDYTVVLMNTSDVLEMGHETRYDVEDLYARPAPVIVPRHLRLGVPGRMRADGSEYAPLDETSVRKAAHWLIEEHGIDALAIAFLHSYANPAHEIRARDLIRETFPDLLITLSAEVAPEIREYERTNTACVNAYVQPRVRGYLNQLQHDLDHIGFTGRLFIMLSGGGITTIDQAKAFPVRLLESGPAADAIAAAFMSRAASEPRVISFDMGGTTAKMCLVEHGQPHVKHTFEAGRLEKFKPGSGLPLRLTVVDMIEIGAGGGSIATVDDLGLMKVGPRSAGAVPGPVAYSRGGTEPTVTDADLIAGYLSSERFLGGDLQLSVPAIEQALGRLGEQIRIDARTAAAGIEELVVENMAAATRMHLAEQGRDPREYTLMAFGGAGPVHACALAKRLRISRIVIPVGAGVMSAFGFLVAAPTVDDVRGYPAPLISADWGRVAALYDDMESRARRLLLDDGGAPDGLLVQRSADMRYIGQGFEINVPLPAGTLDTACEDAIHHAFVDTYQSVFGRTIRDGTPEIINWRLSASLAPVPLHLAYRPVRSSPGRPPRRVFFTAHGEFEVAVHDRSALTPGTTIAGPALFEDRETPCSVGPDCTVTIGIHHNLVNRHRRRRTLTDLEEFGAWDTPALSNALDALRLRPFNGGYTNCSIQRITGSSPMVGRAVTARMVAREPGEDGIPVSHLHRAIAETEGPVVVVLEDCDEPAGAGAFLGEVNGSLLAALCIKGLVTNGRVRDVNELRQFRYPVFAAGLCVARSYMRLVEVGAEVTVAGMTVRPGDIVHGDEHGVLQIPDDALPAIFDKAELIREDEENVVGWSRSTDFNVEALLQLRRVRH
jgi:N-methylhydantoinase A